MIERTDEGLYCRAADAWVDPWRPVPRAPITHAHADHARPGCGEYWAVASSEGVLRQRLGKDITLHPVRYCGSTGWDNAGCRSTAPATCSDQPRSASRWMVRFGWSAGITRDADPSCEP